MRISVTYMKKVPIRGIDYGSHGHHLTIEAEPPPEVCEDRERLRKYIAALFAESRDRVDEEMIALDRDAVVEPEARPRLTTSRRQSPPATRAPQNGRREEPTLASPKQLNYLRSLSSDAGYDYRGLADLSHQEFGVHDIRELTKRQASELIDGLRRDRRSA